MLVSKITKKQQEIIHLIYTFRFLNRIQIQTILNHKDYKRINVWLKDLVNKKYVGRIYEYKLDKINKPAIYYMGVNGIKFLQNSNLIHSVGRILLKRLRREKHKSPQFINHNIYIAELYCMCLRYAREANRTITFFTKMDMVSHTILGDLLPDTYVKIKDQHRKAKRYLIEVFKEGMPRFAIRYRIKQYLTYYQDETWQQNTNRPFPIILFITPEDKRYNQYIKEFTQRAIDEEVNDLEELNIIIVTKDDVKVFGIDDLLWLEMKDD